MSISPATVELHYETSRKALFMHYAVPGNVRGIQCLRATVLNFNLAPDNYVNIWTALKPTRWIQSALCKYRIHNLLVYPQWNRSIELKLNEVISNKEHTTDKTILKMANFLTFVAKKKKLTLMINCHQFLFTFLNDKKNGF